MTRAERDATLSAWDAAVAAYKAGWLFTSVAVLQTLHAVVGVGLAPPSIVAQGGTR